MAGLQINCQCLTSVFKTCSFKTFIKRTVNWKTFPKKYIQLCLSVHGALAWDTFTHLPLLYINEIHNRECDVSKITRFFAQ